MKDNDGMYKPKDNDPDADADDTGKFDDDLIDDLKEEDDHADDGVSLVLQYNSLEKVCEQYTFDDVGGLDKIKQEMVRYAKAIANPEPFNKYGIKPPKGIILAGPPGYGKTLLAKCFAAEVGKYIRPSKANTTKIMFAQLNLEEFVSHWLGQTSSNLNKALMGYKSLIHKAQQKDLDLRIIVYMDEMDAIAAKREDTHEAYQKMMGVLLKHMDGMEASPKIYWIGSTNRADALDPAITRPGRFDKLIEVNGYEKGGIREIYTIHINKATELSEFERLFDIERWDRIQEASKAMSGAEIAEITRRCVEYALWKEVDHGVLKVPLSEKHVLKEIELFYKGKESDKPKKEIGYKIKD